MEEHRRAQMMLTRIYIDNYKCLVNFELQLKALTLLVGDNGSGKSAIFEVGAMLRGFIGGDQRVDDLFARDDCTRWLDQNTQTFELEIGGADEACFVYRLVIEHASAGKRACVAEEMLTYDGKPLFVFQLGQAQLYHDNHEPGLQLIMDETRSGLAGVIESADNRRLCAFRTAVARFTVISPEPKQMEGGATSEANRLDYSCRNFVAWYRGQAQGNPRLVLDAIKQLKETLPGFQGMALIDKSTEYRELMAEFGNPQKTYRYRFDKLSDGQRMLIVLYMVLFADSPNRTLYIEEPNIYVPLPQIQAWLANLYECGDTLPQVLLTSHHPEAIDFLSEATIWLKRDPEGPTRLISATEIKNETILSNAKLYAQRVIP